MKLLIATILLVGAVNTFAACTADGSCDSAGECTALAKDGKKFDYDASAKKCLASKQQDQLPDCKFVYDGAGGDKSGTDAAGAKKADGSTGK